MGDFSNQQRKERWAKLTPMLTRLHHQGREALRTARPTVFTSRGVLPRYPRGDFLYDPWDDDMLAIPD